MRVTVLTEYTGLWVQQPREVQPRNAIRSAPQTRVPSNVPQAVERLGAPEFSKDDLKRLKEFMTKIGEKVDSIDGVIRDFERIDTTRKGTITAEQ